jgi:hypothetical protein
MIFAGGDITVGMALKYADELIGAQRTRDVLIAESRKEVAK